MLMMTKMPIAMIVQLSTLRVVLWKSMIVVPCSIL